MKVHDYSETDNLHIELHAEPGAETREIADGLNVDLYPRYASPVARERNITGACTHVGGKSGILVPVLGPWRTNDTDRWSAFHWISSAPPRAADPGGPSPARGVMVE